MPSLRACGHSTLKRRLASAGWVLIVVLMQLFGNRKPSTKAPARVGVKKSDRIRALLQGTNGNSGGAAAGAAAGSATSAAQPPKGWSSPLASVL